MIIKMVIKFITVNILFKIDDSFTPTLSNIMRSITTVNAKKSGYSDKNETLIGIKECNVSLITFPIKASK